MTADPRHHFKQHGLVPRHARKTPLEASRELLSEAARAYAHGTCSLEDVEEAARDVERAKTEEGR